MDMDKYAKICEAGRTLCYFCENDACENCIVNHLLNDAYNELPDRDRDYLNNGYYSDEDDE